MSRERYKDINFRNDSLILIDVMNGIIKDYVKQGFVLTVRQLYYQLVARAVVENTEKSYSRICELVNNAKLAGYMDWEAIEDRTREFIRRSHWTTAEELVAACAKQFHMDLWEGQSTRCFVIVEKEALAGVLEGVCHRYDMPLLAARGYPSGTILRSFCEEDIIPALNDDQDVLILHLGDHDPSGIDMSRDLEERINLFIDSKADSAIERTRLRRIALNMDQIKRYKPPPNPAKVTDSRFGGYAALHGTKSWELDALSPATLAALVEEEVKAEIDEDKWQERQDEIKGKKELLDKAAKDLAEREGSA